MTTPLLLAVIVLAWARATRKPWSELGLKRTSARALVLGGLLGGALKIFLKAVVMPLLGADPVNRPYHWLVGNTAALPGFLLTLLLGAGFAEELVFRGFLFDRVRRFLGEGRGALAFAVIGSTMLFALAHGLEQGTDGVRQAVITGLVFGTMYARTKNLWPVMAAHFTFDVVALALIYWNVEARVAHLLFH